MSRWGLSVALLMLFGCGSLSGLPAGDCPDCAGSPTGQRIDDPATGPHDFTSAPGAMTPSDGTTAEVPAAADTPADSQSAADTPIDEASTDEEDDSSADEAPASDPTNDPAPSDPPIHDPFVFDPTLFGSGAYDSFIGLGLTDPDYFDELLSFAVDNLVLDLIGPTSSADTFTHLELLCRDLGLPDHYCRQRYGP